MNSLCTISGHGFRGVGKSNLPPSAITSVAATTVTATSIVFTWSGGLAQDGNTVTTTYTMNGSGTSPSSSGTGTATFTGLSTITVYTLVVTATNIVGNTTGNTQVSTIGLLYNFKFQNDVLDYHTGSGVSVGTLTNGNIYWQSTGGYNSSGCLYCSTNTVNETKFTFPYTPLKFFQSLGFSVSFWFKGIKGTSDGVFVVGNGYNRYNIMYHSDNNCMFFDDGVNYGDIGYTITENQWYHICWVIQPNTAPTYFYFNGGSVNGGQTINMGTSTAHNVSCNSAAVFDDNTGVQQAKGYMNNLNIFNYAITQSQITALYQA